MDITSPLTDILSFLTKSIFLEQLKLEYYETDKSEEKWKKLELRFHNKYIDDPRNLTMSEKIAEVLADLSANNPYKYFSDENTYMIDLKERLGEHGIYVTFFELRMTDPYAMLKADTTFYDTSSAVLDEARLMIMEDYDYIFTSYNNKYYKDIDFYNKFLHFILIIFVAFKTYNNHTVSEITLSQTNERILNNYMDSYGFIFFSEIPKPLKSAFALSMFELYRNKGSYNNINKLIKLFRKKYEVFSIYFYVEPLKLIYFNDNHQYAFEPVAARTLLFRDVSFADIRAVKVPISPEPDTEITFNKIMKMKTNGENIDEYIVNYKTIIDNDNQWQMSVEELGQVLKDHSYIKTKYHYLDASVDFEAESYLLSLATIVCRWLPDTIEFSNGKIEKFKLRQIIAMLVSISSKIHRIDYDILNLVSEPQRDRVASTFTQEELKERVSGITSMYELKLFFDLAREDYTAQKECRIREECRETFIDVDAGKNVSYDVLFMNNKLAFNELRDINNMQEMLLFYDEIFNSLIIIFDFLGINLSQYQLRIIDYLEYFSTYRSKFINENSNDTEPLFAKPDIHEPKYHNINGILTISECKRRLFNLIQDIKFGAKKPENSDLFYSNFNLHWAACTNKTYLHSLRIYGKYLHIEREKRFTFFRIKSKRDPMIHFKEDDAERILKFGQKRFTWVRNNEYIDIIKH